MYNYRKHIHVIVFVIIVMVSFNIDHNPFQVESQATFSPVEIVKGQDPLYQEIEEKSERYNEEPEDAYIDRVWKKIPGRNGRQVDIAASYERMKKLENLMKIY